MKKDKLLFLLFFIFSSALFSQTPQELKGIWQAEDRILFLGEDNEISIILKVFDRWYFDRAGESENFENPSTREKNSATSPDKVVLKCEFTQIDEDSSSWEIAVYDGKKLVKINPVCLLADKLYLNFLNKIDEDDINGKSNEEKTINGYWQAVNSSENIRISEKWDNDNIYSYYVTEDAVYRLRFWKTKMAFDSSGKATFNDGDNIFSISKHIHSGGKTYTCTSGRSSRIRNINKFSSLPFEYKCDENFQIMAIGKENFSRADKSSKEELLEIVKEANSRRKGTSPSLFPEEDLDFHWDLIDQLEKGNKTIEKVRERQKEFGPRGKDSGK